MRSFIDFFIRKRITTIMAFCAVIIFGCISLVRIPSALMPPTEKKGVTISVRYPGQSPWRIERLIVIPIEEAISMVGGIESIVAACKEGEAKLYVTFAEGVDMKYKTVQLREKIDPVRAGFPRDVDEPEIYGSSGDDRPVMIITLRSASMSINALRELAEKRYKKLFERVEGVSEVAVGGGVKREIEIAVLENRLVSHGISFDRVMKAIQMNNFTIPAGTVGSRSEHSLLIDGKYKSLDDIRNTPILATKAGSPVLIGDIAVVNDYAGRREELSRINGTENVSIYIMKVGTANAIQVSEQVRSVVGGLTDGRLTVDITYDQAEFIKRAIHNLTESCIIGIVLASIVLFAFFRSAREALPVMLAIPFSILPVFIYLYFRGMSLNVISLSGLALAAGMVVDSGIVVLDAINKRRSAAIVTKGTRGRPGAPEPIVDTCREATAIVARPIFASTVTSVCIFVPLSLFGGKNMGLYRDMAGSVIVALVSSFFIALTLIPLAASYCIGYDSKRLSRIGLLRSAGTIARRFKKLSRVARALRAGHAVAGAVKQRTKSLPPYGVTIHRLFNNRKILTIAIVLFLAVLVFLSSFLKEEFLEPLESNEIYATVELPSGTSLDETARITESVEKTVRGERAIRELSSKVEKGHADLIMKLDDGTNKLKIIDALKKRLAGTTEAFVFFQEERSSESSRELDLEITGPDVAKIREIARDLSQRLSTVGGIDDVVLRFKEGRPAIEVIIDSKKAMETGLSSGTIGDFVRSSLFGPVSSKFVDVAEVDMRCRMLVDEAALIDRLPQLKVISGNGKAIPLGEVASFKRTEAISTVSRKDRQRMETITVKLGPHDIRTFVKKADRIIAGIQMPAEYHVNYGDSLKNLFASKKEMLLAIVLAVILVYMVVASIFESFLVPLIVLAAIPLSLIGVLFAMIAFGRSFNISVYMGMIILVGIVVNNAIVLIDAMEKKRLAGERHDLNGVISIARLRIRPIAMTTLATSLGLLPLLFGGSGGSLWRGFALTVIAGISVSGILVLYIIPVAYHVVINRSQLSKSVAKSVSR